MSADENSNSAQGEGSDNAPTTPRLEDLMSTITPIKEEAEVTTCTQSHTKPCVIVEMSSPQVDEAGRRREVFCLFLAVELTRPFGENAGSRAIPPYAWTNDIITSYLRSTVNPITQIIVVNQTECVVFSGVRGRKEGMTEDQAYAASRRLSGPCEWVGHDVMIRAAPMTLDSASHTIANAKQFIRTQTLHRITQRQVAKNTEAQLERLSNQPPKPRGRGMTRRADQYIAQKSVPGLQGAVANLRDGYATDASQKGRSSNKNNGSSGKTKKDDEPDYDWNDGDDPSEPSDSNNDDSDDSDESDDGDSDETVVGESDAGYTTGQSKYSTVNSRQRKRNKMKRRDRRRFRKQKDRGGGGSSNAPKHFNLPIFRGTTGEMSISYQDWRKDVNALMRRKIPEKKILDAIMNSVEGGPGETASVAYEKGKGTLKEVLEALDTVHGRSISYIKLHSDLCAMRQYYDEDVVCYYTRMNSIVYLLQEHHDTQFPPGQLARFTKQAFYDGLLEKYKPLVSHLMDRPKKGVGVVLSAVRKAEEAEERQLAARRMEARSGYNKNGHGSSKGYSNNRDYGNANRSNNNNNRTDPKSGYGVRVGDPGPEEDDLVEEAVINEEDREQIYRDGMYIGITKMADDDDKRTGTCFNCKECGHMWRQCPLALREDLQRTKDREGLDHRRLNRYGEGVAKGGRPSQKGTGGRVPESTPTPQ